MKHLRTLSFVVAAVIATTPLALAGDMKDSDKSASMEKMDMAEHRVGDLVLKGLFARATLPNQPVAGAFLTIANMGREDDVLVGLSTPVAAKGEVHEMAMEGDTMKMRQLADGLVIPAGETVELKPGGYHLMFMKLNEPLVEGETVEATLEFQNAGTVTVPFSILGKGAKSMDHGGQGS
ncbi:MAG: copper chaperone PCu(A)C [Paracoccaceae bacterium]|nr:copper chaperone PCu(A)C [Paracoccaceae bacterium]